MAERVDGVDIIAGPKLFYDIVRVVS